MDNMTPAPGESKVGFYNIFYTENGKRLVVLSGHSPDDQNGDHVLHDMILAHYNTVEFFYWVLFCATAVYLIGLYLCIPLYKKLTTLGMPMKGGHD